MRKIEIASLRKMLLSSLNLTAVPLLALLLVALGVAQTHEQLATMVYEQPSNQWFEGPLTTVAISPDGEWALFTLFGRVVRLVSLKAGQEDRQRLTADLDSFPEAAVFCGRKLARLGKRGTEHGWFLSGDGHSHLTLVPPDAVPQCSSDASEIAYYLSDRRGTVLSVGPIGKPERYEVAGKVTGTVFAPDGKALYALAFGADGRSSLLRVTPSKPGIELIASDLDAMPFAGAIAVAPDGRSLFLPLATDAAPDNATRHQPNAQRWLKIYRLSLSDRTRQPVAESANQDIFDPAVAEDRLYWTRNVLHAAVASLPIGGGEAREIVVGGQLPIWSFDGRRISYTFGGSRLADWALDSDAGIIAVDTAGVPTSEPSIIVSGFHEDFPAAISPNGRWIAFHSHRSKMPVAEYSSPGSADDVYLRRADDIHAPEMRLTDFGWETGPAFWSPDGRKLMFSSMDKRGQTGIYKTWIITLHPESGKVIHTAALPLPSSIRSAQWASWSPDGADIAIEDDRGGEDRVLWITRADGTHAEKVLEYTSSTYGGVDWAPDGKTLIYSGLASGRMQLFAISRHGGSPRQLSHDSGNLMHPRVSPDGRWIACTRLIQSQQIWRAPLPR
jgi:Tol biopolymer transport system component